MKLALRLLTLALCAFAWYENALLTQVKPCETPSAIVAEDPVFHQQSIWVETISIGGEPVQPCPDNQVCL